MRLFDASSLFQKLQYETALVRYVDVRYVVTGILGGSYCILMSPNIVA